MAARPERTLIRPHGSFRHVNFHLSVANAPSTVSVDRSPVTIGLVLDRSGSMHGQKIATARMAALAVLDRLGEQDRVAAVVFDHEVDVLQEAAPASAEVKARLRAELKSIQARGNTALHEGWLTGCRVIAPESASGNGLSRCFLLTDGLANVGVTDAEQIAAQAADVRANAGIGTSPFGIGSDYDEGLLGRMAVADGGQFHNLRSPAEIATTFLGELGELLAVAVRNVRLEIEAAPGTSAELISPFWLYQSSDGAARWSVSLGDLLAGEQRDVVVRFGFLQLQLGQAEGAVQHVRARVAWTEAAAEHHTEWQEVFFEYADHAARTAERPDPDVQRVVGLHHAERAQRQAIERSRRGDIDGARQILQAVARRLAEYAGADPQLQDALAAVRAAERELGFHGYSAPAAKEAYYASQLRTRGQRDLRQTPR
jgi:Ca-activated chloride channel family protein